jgi:hypothetical protein
LGIAKIFLTANENNPISKALPEIVLPFLWYSLDFYILINVYLYMMQIPRWNGLRT